MIEHRCLGTIPLPLPLPLMRPADRHLLLHLPLCAGALFATVSALLALSAPSRAATSTVNAPNAQTPAWLAAAAAAKYEGRVKGAGPLSFRLGNDTVRRFQASVTVTCISVTPARSETEVYVVAPTSAAKLTRTDRFDLKVDLPKQQFTDSSGKVIETLYSVKASVEGRVPGKSASGTLKVSYNKYWTAYNPSTGFYALTPASCFSGQAKIPWNASRK